MISFHILYSEDSLFVNISKQPGPAEQAPVAEIPPGGRNNEPGPALVDSSTAAWTAADECSPTENEHENVTDGQDETDGDCPANPSGKSNLSSPAPNLLLTVQHGNVQDCYPEPDPSPATSGKKHDNGLKLTPDAVVPTASLSSMPTSASNYPRIHMESKEDALVYASQATSAHGRLLLWTDASYMSKGNGSGAFVRQGEGDRWEVHAFLATQLQGIFEFETLAILKAMQWALAEVRADPGSTTAVAIMTDSQASLTEFQRIGGKRRRRRRYVADVAAVTQELQTLQVAVEFHWVPAHSHIPGNTIADFWTRKAYKTLSKAEPIAPPPDIDLPVLHHHGKWEGVINTLSPTAWLEAPLPGLVVASDEKKSKKLARKEAERASGKLPRAKKSQRRTAKSEPPPEAGPSSRTRGALRRARRAEAKVAAETVPIPSQAAAATLSGASVFVDEAVQTLSEAEFEAMERLPWAFEVLGRLHPELARRGCTLGKTYGRVGFGLCLKSKLTYYVGC